MPYDVTGVRDPEGDRAEQKPKKKKRGHVRSLTLRPPASSTAGSMPQGLPFSLGFISHNMVGRNPKGKKVRLYAVARAPAGEYISTAVHVNSEPLAALSGMTAVALPWVSLRILHQPFPLWIPWAISLDDDGRIGGQ